MFSNILKQLRKEKGYTQSELAKLINSSTSKIAMWETEKRDPVKEDLVILSEIFDVSVDYLLGRTDNRNLTVKDEKSINKEKDIEKIIDELMEQQGLMLCGEPMNEDDMLLLRNSIRSTIELAKTMKKKN